MSLFGDLPPAGSEEMSKADIGYDIGKASSQMLPSPPSGIVRLEDKGISRNNSEVPQSSDF